MNARPLKVLLAIEDRKTLRHAARLLAAFGHRVSSAASRDLAIARLRSDRPDLLVAGGDCHESAAALLQAAATESPQQQTFKLLLVNDPTPNHLLKLLEAGADDFLAAPIESAELLGRLRTAARMLEFERRLAGLAPHEDAFGLLTRQAFLLRLQGDLEGAQRSHSSMACLVLQPDAYNELRELHGLPAAARAIQELVTRINDIEQPHACCGRIDEKRLALAFPTTAEDALAFAEQLRANVGQACQESGDANVPCTISAGVTVGGGDTVTATQLLEHAEKALLLAQQSGGDRVVHEDEVSQEERRWSELAGGRLFEGAVLRNIMVPFPRLLRTTDSLQQADSALRQTRLAALPVVDDDGKLAGLLSADHARPRHPNENHGDTPVAQCMNKQAVSFDEATTLPVLIDYFTREAPPVVVVVHKGRPTGLVTPASLATLVEPLTNSSFIPGHNAPGRASLIVPHLSLAE